MTLPFGFTLTVKRPGRPDRVGNPTPGPTHTIPGWAAAPSGSSELVNGQATVVEQDTIYGPADADINSQDIAVIPTGQAIPAGDYQVDGAVQRFRSPFTGNDGMCVVRLTRADAR